MFLFLEVVKKLNEMEKSCARVAWNDRRQLFWFHLGFNLCLNVLLLSSSNDLIIFYSKQKIYTYLL